MLTTLALLFAFTPAHAVEPDLRSPEIHGDTLTISGTLDSHVYDFLSYEAKAMANVKYVELDSYGGNAEWALAVAEKLSNLKITTRLSSGHVCASACVWIFAAGKRREIADDAWLGIHGVRLGASYTTSFAGYCFTDLDDGSSVFEPRRKGCADFLAHWYEITKQATDATFDFMERNGVSPTLRATYYAMADDPAWPAAQNVLRKPDWVLTANEALGFSLATKVVVHGNPQKSLR